MNERSSSRKNNNNNDAPWKLILGSIGVGEEGGGRGGGEVLWWWTDGPHEACIIYWFLVRFNDDKKWLPTDRRSNGPTERQTLFIETRERASVKWKRSFFSNNQLLFFLHLFPIFFRCYHQTTSDERQAYYLQRIPITLYCLPFLFSWLHFILSHFLFFSLSLSLSLSLTSTLWRTSSVIVFQFCLIFSPGDFHINMSKGDLKGCLSEYPP